MPSRAIVKVGCAVDKKFAEHYCISWKHIVISHFFKLCLTQFFRSLCSDNIVCFCDIVLFLQRK
jgi:hypothetical protein